MATLTGDRLEIVGQGDGLDVGDVGSARELLERLAGVARPSVPLTVLVGADWHRQVFPVNPPADASKLPAVLRPVRAAGWHRPGHPDGAPVVTRSVVMERKARTVRLVPAAWLRVDDWPRVRQLDGETVAELDVLAERLDAFRRRVGWNTEGTIPATSVRIMRDMLERSASKTPKWQGSAGQWPRADEHNEWSRELTEVETAAGWVHGWDVVRCYLPAISAAKLAGDDLRYDPDPSGYEPDQAGLWRITVPHMPVSEHPLPAPVGRPPGTEAVVTTAVLDLYSQLGIRAEIHECWTAPAVAFAGTRHLVGHLRSLLDADTTDTATYHAVKHLYRSLHGKLREPRQGGSQGIVTRPDWGHAIRDAAWTATVRRTWQAAGVLPLPARIVGRGVRKHTDRPAWPVAIRTDEVLYAGGPDAVAPAGIEVGAELGQHKHKRSLTVAEWMNQEGSQS